MGVEMRNALAAILTLIDHESVPVREAVLGGNRLCGIQDRQVVAALLDIGQAGNFRLRNDDRMERRLGRNVPDGEDMLVLVQKLRRNFTIQDSRKERGHCLSA